MVQSTYNTALYTDALLLYINEYMECIASTWKVLFYSLFTLLLSISLRPRLTKYRMHSSSHSGVMDSKLRIVAIHEKVHLLGNNFSSF